MADKKTAAKAATKKTLKGGKKIGNTKLMGGVPLHSGGGG